MPGSKKGYVYILFSSRNGTLYTGVTSNLVKRIYEHKENLVEGFSKKYKTDKLGYYEEYATVVEAIEREKQIKKRSRKYKIGLIEKENPKWHDLYNSLT
jgi:putative endonuclease